MDERSRQQDRRHRRALLWGLTASVVAHAVLFLVYSGRPLPLSPFAAAGERRGDLVAAAGGGLEAVQLRPPSPILRPPPPVPAPTQEFEDVTLPEPEMTEQEIPAVALEDEIAVPGTEGRETPGLETGTGQGDGGTEAEGRFRVIPPRPKGLILPPSDRPDDVRGQEVEVWVYVASTGQVVPDSTRLFPSTGDRRFDRRLRDHAASWVFDAALRDGQPVGEWFHYTIIM